MNKTIPVHEARRIGQEYSKDMVVILTYSGESNITDAATWGKEPEDKELAVAFRDSCLKKLDISLELETVHQDYRFITEGERAQVVDNLVRACRSAEEIIEAFNFAVEGTLNEDGSIKHKNIHSEIRAVRKILHEAIKSA